MKVDDGFAEHPKVFDLSDRAFRLHVSSLCYSARNLTDGILHENRVQVCCAIARASRKHVQELVDAELWLPFSDGYQIRDFLEYNPSAAKVKEMRRSRSEAGRVGGKKSGEARREANCEANASANGKAVGLNPVPSPAREDLKASVDRSLRSIG